MALEGPTVQYTVSKLVSSTQRRWIVKSVRILDLRSAYQLVAHLWVHWDSRGLVLGRLLTKRHLAFGGGFCTVTCSRSYAWSSRGLGRQIHRIGSSALSDHTAHRWSNWMRLASPWVTRHRALPLLLIFDWFGSRTLYKAWALHQCNQWRHPLSSHSSAPSLNPQGIPIQLCPKKDLPIW